tara:strand:+ start:5081 stop:5500 length:420 start_codon:yes stop_codon:yes gene_type:complete
MRINLNNDGKVREALASVNGAATAHTFTSASDIATGLAMAELELKSLGLRKPSWKGAQIIMHSPGPTARAYKYATIGTQVELERGANSWLMVDAMRRNYRPAAANREPRVWLRLQDCHRHAAIEALKARIECCYRVGAS